MSHFSVLALAREGQDVEGLLLPYMENCCGEPPREYMEFFEDEECEADEETGCRGYWQNPNARWGWYRADGGCLHRGPLAAGPLTRTCAAPTEPQLGKREQDVHECAFILEA